jgi:hypothetical protein
VDRVLGRKGRLTVMRSPSWLANQVCLENGQARTYGWITEGINVNDRQKCEDEHV